MTDTGFDYLIETIILQQPTDVAQTIFEIWPELELVRKELLKDIVRSNHFFKETFTNALSQLDTDKQIVMVLKYPNHFVIEDV